MSSTRDEKPNPLPHHIRQEECIIRKKYREGRKPTAVRVFTPHHESKYLLVFNVPALNLMGELYRFASSVAPVESHEIAPIRGESFTDVHLLKMSSIRWAQVAKRRLDDASFYGAVLHVVYAPEHETLEETREKLMDRGKRYEKRLAQVEVEKNEGKTIVSKFGPRRTNGMDFTKESSESESASVSDCSEKNSGCLQAPRYQIYSPSFPVSRQFPSEEPPKKKTRLVDSNEMETKFESAPKRKIIFRPSVVPRPNVLPEIYFGHRVKVQKTSPSTCFLPRILKKR